MEFKKISLVIASVTQATKGCSESGCERSGMSAPATR